MGKSHGNVMWRSLRLGRRSPDYIVNDAREYFAANSVTADISTTATRKNALECIGDNANTDKIPSPYKPDSRLYKNLIPPTPTPPGPAPPPLRLALPPFVLSVRCNSLQKSFSLPFPLSSSINLNHPKWYVPFSRYAGQEGEEG